MKINSVQFSPSFQKKLVAKANVIKEKQPCPVSIYELTKKEDKDYFESLTVDGKWGLSEFADDIAYDFKYSRYLKNFRGKEFNFYSMEDKDGNCLGILEVDNSKKYKQNIKYIEAVPENSKKREKAIFLEKEKLKYKYIGETMLAFLAKQQESKLIPKQIVVQSPLAQARNFYLNSYFCFDDKEMFLGSMHLPFENQVSLIEDNEKHTQAQIELMRGKNVK